MVIIINMYTILVQHPLLNMIYTGFGSRFKGRSPEGKNAFFETLPELSFPSFRATYATFSRHRNSRFESQFRTKNALDTI